MRGFTSGNSTRSCTLTISAGRSILRAAPQQEHCSGRCSTTASGVSLATRLWPSWPGLAPPGLDVSRCSLRSVEGGLEEVREVFSGRCSRSTSSISSSLLRRSRSLRPISSSNQRNPAAARTWVITKGTTADMNPAAPEYPLARRDIDKPRLRDDGARWLRRPLEDDAGRLGVRPDLQVADIQRI